MPKKTRNNVHVENAAAIKSNAYMGLVNVVDATLISAEANLAMATELRTANMFKYLELLPSGSAEWADLRKELDARLYD